MNVLKVDKVDGKYLSVINGTGTDVANAMGIIVLNVMEINRKNGMPMEDIRELLDDLQVYVLSGLLKGND